MEGFSLRLLEEATANSLRDMKAYCYGVIRPRSRSIIMQATALQDIGVLLPEGFQTPSLLVGASSMDMSTTGLPVSRVL